MKEDWQEIERRFDRMSLDEKLRIVEHLVRRIRLGTPDRVEMDRRTAEMAHDADLLCANQQVSEAG